MKVFKSLVMVIVSVGFVMSMSSAAWSFAIWTEEGKKFNAEVDSFSKLYLIGADGKKSLAKDGTYKTKDGKTIRVKRGIVGPSDTRGIVGPSDTRGIVGPPDDGKSLKMQNPPDDGKSLKLR